MAVTVNWAVDMMNCCHCDGDAGAGSEGAAAGAASVMHSVG